MKKRTLVSLGISCQTAHQLARFTNEHSDPASFQKGPFDWLICPVLSAAEWLDNGLIDFTQNEITIARNHAYWPKFGFWFWHGFYTKSDTERKLKIYQNTPREQEKLAYQRAQFQNLDPQNTIFIISNTQNNLLGEVFKEGEESLFHFTNDHINKLQSSLDRYFGTPINLKIITREHRADKALLDQANTYILSAETSDWKGENKDWDQALRSLCKN
ncbi:MAG: hypothetical protein V3V02_12405 [Rhizobiaceae bacterium]